MYGMLKNPQFILVVPRLTITDKNILDNPSQLVKNFSDLPLWEYTIAAIKQNILIKGSNCALPEKEILEMFYYLVGIV